MVNIGTCDNHVIIMLCLGFGDVIHITISLILLAQIFKQSSDQERSSYLAATAAAFLLSLVVLETLSASR